MSEMIIFWLILIIVSIVIETLTLGLTSVWFAGGALAALAVAALHLPVAVQLVAFLVVSLLLLYFTRPIAVKYFNNNRKKSYVESLVGRQGIVISEIDNLQGAGQVTVDGKEWSAKNVEDEGKISVGTVVEIVAIRGVKLIVKTDAQMEKIKPVKNPEETKKEINKVKK